MATNIGQNNMKCNTYTSYYFIKFLIYLVIKIIIPKDIISSLILILQTNEPVKLSLLSFRLLYILFQQVQF